MNPVRRTLHLFKNEGIYRSIKIILRHLHLQLPKRKREYVGVEVRDGVLLDPILPWQTDSNPHHESGIISGINREVEQGDNVVIVGGGKGVTAVKAAEKVGADGSVEVYEGAYRSVKKSKQTAKFNDVKHIINVNNCTVGPVIYLSSEEKNAKHITPDELPECDVLELDCEGAEIPIIENIQQKPRLILVESHGIYDSSSDDVIESLKNKGYEILSKEIANEGMREIHEKNDIYAITAVSE